MYGTHKKVPARVSRWLGMSVSRRHAQHTGPTHPALSQQRSTTAGRSSRLPVGLRVDAGARKQEAWGQKSTVQQCVRWSPRHRAAALHDDLSVCLRRLQQLPESRVLFVVLVPAESGPR